MAKNLSNDSGNLCQTTDSRLGAEASIASVGYALSKLQNHTKTNSLSQMTVILYSGVLWTSPKGSSKLVFKT